MRCPAALLLLRERTRRLLRLRVRPRGVARVAVQRRVGAMLVQGGNIGQAVHRVLVRIFRGSLRRCGDTCFVQSATVCSQP